MTAKFARLLLITVFSGFIFSCSSAKLFQECDENNKCKSYTYLTDPEKILNTFAIDNKYDARFQLYSSKLAKMGGEAAVTALSNSILLAEKYDQNNIQVISLAKAAVIGLNMSPTEKDNNDNFWKTLNHVIDHSYKYRTDLLQGSNKFNVDDKGQLYINDIAEHSGRIFSKNGGIIGFWSPNSETYKSADKEKDKFLDLDNWQKSYPIKENFDSFIETNKVTDKNKLRNELEILTSESERLKEDKVIVYFYKQMQVKVSNISSLSYYPTKSRGKHSMKNGLWWRIVTNSDFDIIEFIKFYKDFWNITGNFDMYIEIGGGIGGYNHE